MDLITSHLLNSDAMAGKFILVMKFEDGLGVSTRTFDCCNVSAPRLNVDPDFVPNCLSLDFKLNVPDVKCDIVVRTDDAGYIPHFHILDSGTHGEEIDVCVKIDKAEYFSHGHHQGKLNTSQRRALDEFLSMEISGTGGLVSNWDRIVAEWNKNNSRVDIPASVTKPDYRSLGQ